MMESRYDNDIMAQNQNWGGNWTDFNQNLQSGLAKFEEISNPGSPVEDIKMPSNQMLGEGSQDILLEQKQVSGGNRIDLKQEKCANLQDVKTSTASTSTAPIKEDTKTPDNQDQDDKKNIPQELQKRCAKDDFIPLSTEYAVEVNKIYVGGISNETDQQNLEAYFAKFGEVKHVLLKRTSSAKPWNFAFVTFSSKASVDSVMASTPHVVDGKRVLIGRTSHKQFGPIPRIVKLSRAVLIGVQTKKIFIAGVKPTTTDAQILNYFETFGRVQRLDHPVDRKTKRQRNFCFVSFEDKETVDQVCRKVIHDIGAQKCRVTRARNKLNLRIPPESVDCCVSSVELYGKAIKGSAVDQLVVKAPALHV